MQILLDFDIYGFHHMCNCIDKDFLNNCQFRDRENTLVPCFKKTFGIKPFSVIEIEVCKFGLHVKMIRAMPMLGSLASSS